MLVELQGRPIGLLFEHLVESLPYSGSGGSFYLEKLFAVSISPFTCALMLDQGEKESLLRNFRWTHKYVKVVISLCSPVVFAMSLSFAIVLLFCRACFYPIGFRYSGMRYTILCSLDVFNGNAASICKIFFVVREEPDINDVRSIRTELKRYIDVMQEKMEQKLESKIQKVESKIEKGFAQMHELIAGLNQRTQEVPAMDEESEGLEPPHGNISPQDVEIEAAIEPSEEVSHTEEVEEVTKSTPKTKKKAKRQTKRSAVTTWQKKCWRSSHSWKMSLVWKGICLCNLCVAKPCGYPYGMSGQIGYMYQIDLLQYEHSKETCQKNCPILDRTWYVSDILSLHPLIDWCFFPKELARVETRRSRATRRYRCEETCYVDGPLWKESDISTIQVRRFFVWCLGAVNCTYMFVAHEKCLKFQGKFQVKLFFFCNEILLKKTSPISERCVEVNWTDAPQNIHWTWSIYISSYSKKTGL